MISTKGLLAGAVLLALSASLGSAGATELWTFERALEEALRSNPDAKLARERIAAAGAAIEQANAAFWPQVGLSSSYTATNNPVMVFGARLNQKTFDPQADLQSPNDVPTVDNFNLKGTLNVPLFVGGRHLAGKAAAEAQEGAARHGTATVRAALGFEVARAYYGLVKAKAFERAAEAAVRGFEQNLALAQKRFRAGTLLRADVLDVEVRLARAREDLIRARNGRILAAHALRNLLGMERGPIDVVEKPPGDMPAVPERADLTRRPELRAIDELVRAAEAGVREARSGYYPRVDGIAALQYDAGLELEGDNLSYMAGVQLQWQVWDGLATRARVSQARSALASAHEHRRKVRLALELELAQARIQLKQATERLAVTEKVVAQAQESVDLTRARFEQGLALATQLIDAETALTGARVGRAEAEADQRIALAALRRALGLPQTAQEDAAKRAPATTATNSKDRSL